MFQGFTEETTEFLLGLTFNNERLWFLEHKPMFETYLQAPFKELTGDTLAMMQERFPEEDFQAHISRIYRDARRVYGKGPYQDNLWFTLQKGTTRSEGPVFWFEITAFSYSYGVGVWENRAELMKCFRAAIDADPKGFSAMIQKIPGPYKLYGQEYKRPKADKGPLLNPWYNRRGLSVGYEQALDARVYDPDLPGMLTEAFTRLMPFYRFYRKVYAAAAPVEE